MNERPMDRPQVRGEVQELERQVIAMGNLVESLFADSVMALIERNLAMVPELREDDCRAHERWLEVDRLCTELLTNGELEADEVCAVWTAGRIVTDLKRAADESVRIAEALRLQEGDLLAGAESLASIPAMAELTQSMLGDALEAFVNRDAAEASGLRLVYRELAGLHEQAAIEVARGMTGGEISAETGVAFMDVAERLEHIGEEALNVAAQVNHLCRTNSRQ
jgi:phosphate transport system protein